MVGGIVFGWFVCDSVYLIDEKCRRLPQSHIPVVSSGICSSWPVLNFFCKSQNTFSRVLSWTVSPVSYLSFALRYLNSTISCHFTAQILVAALSTSISRPASRSRDSSTGASTSTKTPESKTPESKTLLCLPLDGRSRHWHVGCRQQSLSHPHPWTHTIMCTGRASAMPVGLEPHVKFFGVEVLSLLAPWGCLEGVGHANLCGGRGGGTCIRGHQRSTFGEGK